MKITIASTDIVYATMLRLELERCGFCASVNADVSALDTASLLVLDADAAEDSYICGIMSEEIIAVIFSRSEKRLSELRGGARRGANIRFFHRPFAIESFLSAANELSEILRNDENITIDERLRTVHLRGESVTLTEQEFRLFSRLYERRGTPLSREEALALLQRDRQTGSNIVDVYIKYIRTKLERGFGDPMIRTVRGKGYMLP